MTAVFLDPFAIRILDKSTGHYETLNKFTGDQDLLNHLWSIAQSNAGQHNVLTQKEKVYEVEQPVLGERTLKGLVRAGKFGVRSDIVDAQTGIDEFQRKLENAELQPYYFAFWIPKGLDEGIAIFQRNGNQSIRESIHRSLVKPFNDHHRNLRLEINKIVDQEYLNEVMSNWRMSRARFIKFGLPADLTDAMAQLHDEDAYRVEVSIQAKQRRDVNLRERILDCIRGRRSYSTILEWRDFEYDDVKIEFERNNKYKTIDVMDLARLKTGRDVTDDIYYTPDGDPVFDSIDQVSHDLIREIAKSIGVDE